MKIPVGVVLYNPDIKRLQENISSVSQHAAEIVLVDNHSSNQHEIKRAVAEYSNIYFLANQKNEGIAKALNQICAHTLSRGYEYVITLDQDSVCPPEMFEEYDKLLPNPEIGIICPVIRDRNHDLEQLVYAEAYTEISRCITSASLVCLKVWQVVGGFDESMFIDGVDFDFCDRVRQCHYKIIRANSVILLHEIGHIQIRRFLFWKVRVKNHGAFRKYYIARNTVYLARKRGSVALYIKAYLQVLKQAGIVLLYETDKKEKLRKMYRGMLDGKNANIPVQWSGNTEKTAV